MARTSDKEVREIIDTNPDISMTPFILTASTLVDKVQTLAQAKGESLTADQLREVERWLAAYYYSHRDPQYTSKSTGGASGSFTTHDYLETAKQLDTSGCLRNLLERKQAKLTWLGRPPSDQTAYVDRN